MELLAAMSHGEHEDIFRLLGRWTLASPGATPAFVTMRPKDDAARASDP